MYANPLFTSHGTIACICIIDPYRELLYLVRDVSTTVANVCLGGPQIHSGIVVQCVVYFDLRTGLSDA